MGGVYQDVPLVGGVYQDVPLVGVRESHAVILRDRVVPASQVPFPGEPSQRGILFLTRNYQTVAKNKNKNEF